MTTPDDNQTGSQPTRDTQAANEQFVRLLAASQQDVLRYVRGLVHNDADAEDVVQETAVALWRKFDQYDPSQSFARWAIAFAHREVYNLRKRRRREQGGAVMFSDDVIELLAEERVEHSDVLESRRRALRYCLEKLSAALRELLIRRYRDKQPVTEMAAESGEKVQSLYKRLSRTRRNLMECVTRKLAEEESQ